MKDICLPDLLMLPTIDAAYTLGVDAKIGSMAAGKFAYFSVLNQDLYAVPKEKIHDIQEWGTIVGEVVFAATESKP